MWEDLFQIFQQCGVLSAGGAKRYKILIPQHSHGPAIFLVEQEETEDTAILILKKSTWQSHLFLI
jgi:hypothetical protein